MYNDMYQVSENCGIGVKTPNFLMICNWLPMSTAKNE